MPWTVSQPAPSVPGMRELLRTTDPLTMARAVDLLTAEGIPCFEFDRHMSVLEGSVGILPRRLMVPGRDHFIAAAILREAGIG